MAESKAGTGRPIPAVQADVLMPMSLTAVI